MGLARAGAGFVRRIRTGHFLLDRRLWRMVWTLGSYWTTYRVLRGR